jgi:hypothetical protein
LQIRDELHYWGNKFVHGALHQLEHGGGHISNGSGGAHISNGPGGAHISNGSGGAHISNVKILPILCSPSNSSSSSVDRIDRAVQFCTVSDFPPPTVIIIIIIGALVPYFVLMLKYRTHLSLPRVITWFLMYRSVVEGEMSEAKEASCVFFFLVYSLSA